MPAHMVSDPSAATVAQRRRRMHERKRERRGALAANTAVLDRFEPLVGESATTSEVRALLGISATTLRNALNRHSDELRADGWDLTADTFTRRAVIRLALILRSPNAKAIAEAAGARYRVMKFTPGERLRHVRRCQAIMDQSLEIAEAIKDEDPAENWQTLNGLDRYTLQGIVVALGALVQLDAAGHMHWLAALPPRHGWGGNGRDPRGGAASGLSMIIPTPDTCNGVPVSQLDDEGDESVPVDDEQGAVA